MHRKTRMALVAGILIAIGTVAVILAVSAAPSEPQPPAADNNNTTSSEPEQILAEPDEGSDDAE